MDIFGTLVYFLWDTHLEVTQEVPTFVRVLHLLRRGRVTLWQEVWDNHAGLCLHKGDTAGKAICLKINP